MQITVRENLPQIKFLETFLVKPVHEQKAAPANLKRHTAPGCSPGECTHVHCARSCVPSMSQDLRLPFASRPQKAILLHIGFFQKRVQLGNCTLTISLRGVQFILIATILASCASLLRWFHFHVSSVEEGWCKPMIMHVIARAVKGWSTLLMILTTTMLKITREVLRSRAFWSPWKRGLAFTLSIAALRVVRMFCNFFAIGESSCKNACFRVSDLSKNWNPWNVLEVNYGV